MSNSASDDSSSLESESESESFDETLGDDDREVINNNNGTYLSQRRSRRNVQPHREHDVGSIKKRHSSTIVINTKRPAPPEVLQKQRKLVREGSVVDDFKCPITLELPIDPVMAIDGKVYERKAIVDHILHSETSGNVIKSPWTREKMTNSDLFSVPADWSSTLKEFISNGTFHGELVETWKKKKSFENLLERAEGGDVKAMEEAADLYQTGERGVLVDKREAFKWYNRAYKDHKSVIGMTCVGDMMVIGEGTKKDVRAGRILQFIAARKGSDFAAYALGTLW